MNNKHLFWIIPCSILLGSFLFNFLMAWAFDFTIDYAAEQSLIKYESCLVAWVEKPLSNNRTLGINNELCYIINGLITCPQRETPIINNMKKLEDFENGN